MTRNGIASPCPATTGIPASGKWRRRRSTTSSTDTAEPRARQVHGLEVRSKVPAKLPVHRIGFCRNSGMRPSEAVWSADDQKASEQNWDAAVDAWAVGRSSCPFLIMCIVSMPAMRMPAQRKDLNPSMGRTMRLIARWSCSTMLLRYFDWRSPMSAPESARMPSMAAVLAPLLSMVIFSLPVPPARRLDQEGAARRVPQGAARPFEAAAADHLGRSEGSSQQARTRVPGLHRGCRADGVPAAVLAGLEPRRIPVGLAQASCAGQLLSGKPRRTQRHRPQQTQERATPPLHHRSVLGPGRTLVMSLFTETSIRDVFHPPWPPGYGRAHEENGER